MKYSAVCKNIEKCEIVEEERCEEVADEPPPPEPICTEVLEKKCDDVSGKESNKM